MTTQQLSAHHVSSPEHVVYPASHMYARVCVCVCVRVCVCVCVCVAQHIEGVHPAVAAAPCSGDCVLWGSWGVYRERAMEGALHAWCRMADPDRALWASYQDAFTGVMVCSFFMYGALHFVRWSIFIWCSNACKASKPVHELAFAGAFSFTSTPSSVGRGKDCATKWRARFCYPRFCPSA